MKRVWKIRLKPDGTWENIYRDEFYPLDGMGLAEWSASKFCDPTPEKLEQLAFDLREMALESSDLREAKEVLASVMKKTKRE